MSMHDFSLEIKQKSWRKRPHLTCEAGFAFVEVLITLVILTLGFLVMLPGITSLLAGEVTQEVSNHALMLARNVIEETKTYDSGDLKLLQEGNPQTVKVESSGNEYWIRRSVEMTPPDDDSLACRLWSVKVWVYDRDPEAAGTLSKCQLETSIFTPE